MNMLGPMLRGLGVEIDEPTLQMVSELLPQLPSKFNEVFQAINKTIENFDGRLRSIELELSIIRNRLESAQHGIAIYNADPGNDTGFVRGIDIDRNSRS